MILFVGGVRSGKSAMAEKWLNQTATQRLYIATALPDDDGMRARIARHRDRRDASWECLEAPFFPVAAFQNFLRFHPHFHGGILIDCLGILLANWLYAGWDDQTINQRASALLDFFTATHLPLAVVSVECNLGFLPMNALARHYGDLLGGLNQHAAAIASSVIFASCGLPLKLK